MKTKKVKISCGTAMVRGPRNREAQMLTTGAVLIRDDYKDDYYQVCSKIADLNNKVYADCVTEHNFKLDGKKLHEFLGELNGKDTEILFSAIMELGDMKNIIPREKKNVKHSRRKSESP